MHVDQCDVGVERRQQHQLLARERAVHLAHAVEAAGDARAHHRARGYERDTHGARAVAQPDRHVAPLLEARLLGFSVMAHHLRDAPDDALAEPAGEDVLAHARSEQQVALGRDDAARDREVALARADQRPDHRHRRA